MAGEFCELLFIYLYKGELLKEIGIYKSTLPFYSFMKIYNIHTYKIELYRNINAQGHD